MFIQSMFSVKMNENDTSKAQLMAGAILVGGMVNIFQNHGNFDMLHGPSCFHLDRNNLRSDFGSLFFGGSSHDLNCVCVCVQDFGYLDPILLQRNNRQAIIFMPIQMHTLFPALVLRPPPHSTPSNKQYMNIDNRHNILSVYCRPFSRKTRHIPLRK